MKVTIYHNPRCAKSRAALELLMHKGVEVQVVEYLKTPPTPTELKRLLAALGMKPRQLLRAKEAKEAGLDNAKLSDEQLIEGMSRNPAVIERPIVVKGDKAALGRPPETVLRIL
jgi:arsenate reductase